jgi:hypothetical protein
VSERQEPTHESEGAPDGGAPSSEDVTVSKQDLREFAEEQIQTKPRDLASRREWTRVGLIVGFFVLFILVFGAGALGALRSDEPWNNTYELVQYALPFVTALGGYIVGHYFPAQDTPQIPEQHPSNQQR